MASCGALVGAVGGSRCRYAIVVGLDCEAWPHHGRFGLSVNHIYL